MKIFKIEIKETLSKIIDHLYDDEKKHFEKSGRPANHIFVKIRRLKSLIACHP